MNAQPFDEEQIDLLCFPVAPLGCNCSIVSCKKTGEAVLIDPGGEAPKIISLLEERSLRVRWIIHTHAHFDHCLGTHAVSDHCRAINEESTFQVGLHRGDLDLYEKLDVQCRTFGIPVQTAEESISHWLEDTEELPFGNQVLEVLHTPGHSPGSCCFRLKGNLLLFSGDTLFAMGIGRTDLWGGDTQAIMTSIKNRLLTLDEGTHVVPGHGPATRIYEEKHGNPFLN